MKIVYADEFVKRFNKLPSTIKKKAVKQELLFSANPLHPSLNTEKLIPKTKQLWSFRVDTKYRVIFTYSKDGIVIFLSIGAHDWVYNYANRL
jgi:mRNA-degrading endonuclease RelE of RelBE toxin-antitoxin system